MGLPANILRTVFFGSPPFAVNSFRVLLERSKKPLALVTAPPRRAGRGRKEVPNPLVEMAEAAQVPVLRPENPQDSNFLDELRGLQPNLGIVVSFGKILSAELLEIPTLGCINLHGSLLPRWRGASPVQAAILAGDSESGVCVQKMVLKLDAGAVLASRSVVLAPDERAPELFDRLARLGADLLDSFLDQVGHGPLPTGVEQKQDAATICHRIRSPEGKVSWEETSRHVDRLVRAMAGWPWAQIHLQGGDVVRILRGEVSAYSEVGESKPGDIVRVEGGIFVCCGDGVYRIDQLQRAGRAVLSAAEFLRGCAWKIGDTLA